MSPSFLLYGANGFVGQAASRLAVQTGLRPILAGRDGPAIEKLASELGLKFRLFDLQDASRIEQALEGVTVLLHCAGPYVYTSKPMVDACLRTGAHYLDLTGEIPVYEAIAARDAEAKSRGVMLLPGVGFDIVPTDCLAVHLKQRLPSATHLSLAFRTEGPGGLPPGTQRTAIELVAFGDRIRRNGSLEIPHPAAKTRLIDFGRGPLLATRLTWGDVFTAYYSTAIPNIEDYAVLPKAQIQLLGALASLRPLLKLPLIRTILKRFVRPGPTADQRARTVTHVWGEVTDDQGRKAVALLHGPEAGVDWTIRAALASVQKVLNGIAPAGYQTPALAFGPDFVLETEGVTREDLD